MLAKLPLLVREDKEGVRPDTDGRWTWREFCGVCPKTGYAPFVKREPDVAAPEPVSDCREGGWLESRDIFDYDVRKLELDP